MILAKDQFEKGGFIVKDTMFRRVISSALALALCCSCGIGAFAAENDASGETDSTVRTTGTDSLRQTSYTNYVDKYVDEARPDTEVTVMGKDYDTASVDGAEITVTTVDGKADVMQWSNQQGSVSYKVVIYNFLVSLSLFFNMPIKFSVNSDAINLISSFLLQQYRSISEMNIPILFLTIILLKAIVTEFFITSLNKLI